MKSETEIVLRQSEVTFWDLVDGSLQGIHIADLNGNVLFVNQIYADIFGIDERHQIYDRKRQGDTECARGDISDCCGS